MFIDQRPPLNNDISVKDFSEFYWLKKELTSFCRNEGLRTTGKKGELANRIIEYLKTGSKVSKDRSATLKPKSTFDWAREELSLSTKITDNYKNTENVRAFFQDQIGPKFKFNVKFMNWMKGNVGATLAEAVEQWHLIKQQSTSSNVDKVIAPQFEYNTYLRDFLKDNPSSSREVGIALWKIKKSRRGDNVYNKNDLSMLDSSR